MVVEDISAQGGGNVKFSSALSTYVTLLGYSLGFSDFWRFPFLVYRNGGGAFLIPFVITMFACGIPLYFLEYAISKFSGKGPYKIWDMCPLFRGTAHAVLAANAMYMLSATALRFWIVEFLIHSFKDPLPWTTCDNDWNTDSCISRAFNDHGTNGGTDANTDNSSELVSSPMPILSPREDGNQTNVMGTNTTAAEEFWLHNALHLSSGISDLQPFIWRYVLVLVIWRFFVSIFVIKSIKSIEKVMYVTTFVPFLLTLAILIRSLTIPGAKDGLYYFFYPEFDKITDSKVWIEAALMAFYTLGPGWGAILMLGSHTDFKENCYRTSIVLPVLDTAVAIFYGMICFSVLGNTAVAYDMDVKDVINTEMSTGIVAYTSALSTLPLPQIWSVFFFASTILSGFDSQMVNTELMVQIIGDTFPRLYPKYRLVVVLILTIVLCLVSLPLCTGAGGYLFLWLDWYSGAWIGPIVAFIEVIAVAWIYGMDRFSEDVALMTGIKMPVIFRLATAIIAPLLVLVIFITSCIDYVPPKYGTYSYPVWARTLGWIIVAIIMVPMPLHAIIVIARDRGSVAQRLQKQTRPSTAWGPSDDTYKSMYQSRMTEYAGRAWHYLLSFNLIGKYPSIPEGSTSRDASKEMTDITHM